MTAEPASVQVTPPTPRSGAARGQTAFPTWLSRLLSWLLLLGVWQFLSTYVVAPFILPPPGRMLLEMIEIARSGDLAVHFFASLTLLVKSFAIFFVVGGVLGTLMGVSKWWEDFLRDAVSLAVSLPGLVYILVLLLVFGTSAAAPLLAVVAAVTPYVILQFWEGVKSVPTDLLAMARSFRMSQRGVIQHVVIPSMSPYIITAFTHGFSLGWRLVVLTELFGGTAGIGFEMRNEFSRFSVRGVIGWALFFFLFAIVLDRFLLVPLSRRALRWRGGQ